VGYTPEQKQQVIALWPEFGTAETERLTGVPARTIIRYVNEAGLMTQDRQEKTAEARAALSEKVAAAWGDFRAQEALAAGSAANRMRRAAIEASDERDAGLLKARVVAYGIFIDKAELLSGQATQRIEMWAESEIDRDLKKAIEEMEERIRGET
jgi:hypothetical protein